LNRQKRALAVHDISCFGKCSLTVALPIISAAGIEASVLPTAVLSTHTGGFTGHTFRDLTNDIIPIANHWEQLGITFDAIYTGYLGSFEQIALVKELIKRFGENALVMVDPVMADNGKLYSGFNDDFPSGMAELCGLADIIVPNMTEVALLLNEPYTGGLHTEEYISGQLQRLSRICKGRIVLTGVGFDDNHIGAACYDNETNEITYVKQTRIPGFFHGTGDIFGSSLLCGLLNNFSLKKSAQIAADFTFDSIKHTAQNADKRHGVRFEAAIKKFALLF